MSKPSICSRILTALVVGCLLALSQVAGPVTSTVSPQIRPVVDYPPEAPTDTDLTLSRNVIRAGERTVARVRVESTVGTPRGTVTFTVDGRSVTKRLSGGRATWVLPRDLEPGTYTVRAHYNGSDRYQESGDTAQLTVKKQRGNGDVAGEEGFGDQQGDGNGSGGADGANRPGTNSDIAGVQGLGDTGADSATTLYGLLGLGLLGAGGALLALRRRARG